MGQPRSLLLEFASDRTLPGQNIGMIVGMDLQRAGLRLPQTRRCQRICITRSGQNHLGPIGANAIDLGLRSTHRYVNFSVDAEGLCGVSDRSAVIAPRRSNYSGIWDRRAQ